MTDTMTPEQRSRTMSRIRSKDTKPELTLRKALWKLGMRYRKNYRQVPGTPDVAFPRVKLAVFVDGAFWHGHDFEATKRKMEGCSNREFWTRKIENNIKRDNRVNADLAAAGWYVLRFWDFDVLKNTSSCVREVEGIFQCLEGEMKDVAHKQVAQGE